MKTEIIPYKPAFIVFLSYFSLMFGLFTLIVITFYLIFGKGEPLMEYVSSVAAIYILVPLINAASFTYSTRKHEYIISDIDDPAYVAGWAVELLQKNGMRIQSAAGGSTVLESGKKYFRVFDNWFGTELIAVSVSEHEVKATGNFRYIDILDTKLKFGRVAFKK